LWRAKDKLRKKDIYVTEDSQARLSERLRAQKEREKDTDRRGGVPAAKPIKKSQSINFDNLPSPTKSQSYKTFFFVTNDNPGKKARAFVYLSFVARSDPGKKARAFDYLLFVARSETGKKT
jgi:hypothetical protein